MRAPSHTNFALRSRSSSRNEIGADHDIRSVVALPGRQLAHPRTVSLDASLARSRFPRGAALELSGACLEWPRARNRLPFTEWYGGAGIGCQFKPILKSHIENIDPDKEHYLVFSGGYEYYHTLQSGKTKRENRAVIELFPGFRPLSWLLLRDRNRTELRWIDRVYSTRYRNELTAEADVVIHGYHFVPYGAPEFFYNGATHSWDQERYTAGVQWPYKRVMMLETYYRRENCSRCKPDRWNVAGATLHFYFRN